MAMSAEPKAAPERWPAVVITGRADSLLGAAGSASEGVIGSDQIRDRVTFRIGEILETIPGTILTQHAGGGKANQYFLRGFNLDHGTDFAITLDGMPMNLPTHGHGQGYADLNPIIPELIEHIHYVKGVSFPAWGDFSSAGAAALSSYRRLPASWIRAEAGMYGYARFVTAWNVNVDQTTWLPALEFLHHDGPWRNKDDFQKWNVHLSWAGGDADTPWQLICRSYHGRWDSTDQIPESAWREGRISRFASLDDTTGGQAARHSLQARFERHTPATRSRFQWYGFRTDLDLWSNFTYYLVDTNRGDQFQQTDQRWVTGGQWDLRVDQVIANLETIHTVGLQARLDAIENGLFQTWRRRRVDKIDEMGRIWPAVMRRDDILQTSAGLFYEAEVNWTDWLRSRSGVRGDLYHVEVKSRLPQNSGERTAGLLSPKGAIVLGPWENTELYLEGGFGFHSNDGRGATTRVDPVTGDPVDPADLLVRTYGAETGIRTVPRPGWQSTLAGWWLDMDSELLFLGDAGTTEASRPSRRYGVEWANYLAFSTNWGVELDLAWSHARFRDEDPAGPHIPGSVETVVTAGVSYDPARRWFGNLRLRFFGPRALLEDNSLRSEATLLLNLRFGYRFSDRAALAVEIFNLLDRRDHDITYAYESRSAPDAPVRLERHFHPVEPWQARAVFTVQF